MQLSGRLDRLHPPPPVTPKPKGDAGPFQRALGRIEIDASQSARPGGAVGELQRPRPRAQMPRGGLIDKKFELDLVHFKIRTTERWQAIEELLSRAIGLPIVVCMKCG
jgi:hypothetical protein